MHCICMSRMVNTVSAIRTKNCSSLSLQGGVMQYIVSAHVLYVTYDMRTNDLFPQSQAAELVANGA